MRQSITITRRCLAAIILLVVFNVNYATSQDIKKGLVAYYPFNGNAKFNKL